MDAGPVRAPETVAGWCDMGVPVAVRL